MSQPKTEKDRQFTEYSSKVRVFVLTPVYLTFVPGLMVILSRLLVSRLSGNSGRSCPEFVNCFRLFSAAPRDLFHRFYSPSRGSSSVSGHGAPPLGSTTCIVVTLTNFIPLFPTVLSRIPALEQMLTGLTLSGRGFRRDRKSDFPLSFILKEKNNKNIGFEEFMDFTMKTIRGSINCLH